jgi:hypothetical protein
VNGGTEGAIVLPKKSPAAFDKWYRRAVRLYQRSNASAPPRKLIGKLKRQETTRIEAEANERA